MWLLLSLWGFIWVLLGFIGIFPLHWGVAYYSYVKSKGFKGNMMNLVITYKNTIDLDEVFNLMRAKEFKLAGVKAYGLDSVTWSNYLNDLGISQRAMDFYINRLNVVVH